MNRMPILTLLVVACGSPMPSPTNTNILGVEQKIGIVPVERPDACPCAGGETNCDTFSRDSKDYYDCYAEYYACFGANDRACGDVFTPGEWDCLSAESRCYGACVEPTGENVACVDACQFRYSYCVQDVLGICDFDCGKPDTPSWYACYGDALHCRGLKEEKQGQTEEACELFCEADNDECCARSSTPCSGTCAEEMQVCFNFCNHSVGGVK